MKTVAIVGGGFSGSLLALKLSQANPDWSVKLIERRIRAGRGLAYGACATYHLLNVPVPRMEVGLKPGFAEWLWAQHPAQLDDALAHAGGDMSATFVPRALFGEYLEERLADAEVSSGGMGLHRVRGNAVRLIDAPRRGLLLEDGREIGADAIVLALGNSSPRPPGDPNDPFYDTMNFVPDPWAKDAFDRLDPNGDLILIGTGLTMVDIALKLAAEGHRGKMYAISRHGLVPNVHASGGTWKPFAKPDTPLKLLRLIRAEVKRAREQNVPWQRVIDAVRPNVAHIWHAWTQGEREQFLRHLRARWEVYRHRMAPRVAENLAQLCESGQLMFTKGRIRGYRVLPDGVEVKAGAKSVRAFRVVNCTGPRSDLGRVGIPLIANLRRRKMVVADPLGLGIETDDCAVIDGAGRSSNWLFALGPLTRPAWWEITAVPEIAVQVDRLVHVFSAVRRRERTPFLAEAFEHLGIGI